MEIELTERGLQRCGACGKALPFAAFAKDRTKTLGVSSTCKSCKKAYVKKKQAGRRGGSKTRRFEKHRKRLEQEQQGCCAICGDRPDKTLCLDHCHETDKLRGLLCTRCNIGLGMFRDSAEHLAAAIQYLS